jgi:hypothetical protein
MARLKWIVALPFDRQAHPVASRATQPSLAAWQPIDLGDGLKTLGSSPIWAWDFILSRDSGTPKNLIVETQMKSKHCWPTSFRILGPGDDQSKATTLLQLSVKSMTNLRLIRSSFGSSTVEVRFRIDAEEQSSIEAVQREQLVTRAYVSVENSSLPIDLLTWARRLVAVLALEPPPSTRDRGNVYYEFHPDSSIVATPQPAVSEASAAVPFDVEVAEDIYVHVAWSPWGLEVRPTPQFSSNHPEIAARKRSLSLVHLLARLQHQRLLDLSEVITNVTEVAAAEVAPTTPAERAIGAKAGATVASEHVTRRSRRAARDKTAQFPSRGDQLLSNALEDARGGYLQLLQSGLFSYVNRVPIVQKVYDSLRHQIRLDETHEEVRLEIYLLSQQIEARLATRRASDEARFRDLVKVTGASVGMVTMVAALLDLVEREATSLLLCGGPPMNGSMAVSGSLRRALATTMCGDLSSILLSLAFGLAAGLGVAWFVARRRRRATAVGEVRFLAD